MSNIKLTYLKIIAIFAICLPVHADWVNVKTWNANPSLNAKGDGLTDDSAAVQQAIYSLASGGTLYFPAGVYRLGATKNVGSGLSQNYALLVTNTGVTIRGDGPSSVLLQTNCQTTLVLADFATSIAGLTLEDIKFQGDTNGLYSSPADSYSSGKLFVCAGIGKASGWTKYLRVKNVWTDDQGKRNAFQIIGMDDVVIDSCRFIHYATTNANMGTGFPSVWISSEGLGSFHLVNNYFDGNVLGLTNGNGADGLVWEQTGEETVITGNTINNFKLEGIQCGARQQTISGNVFRTTSPGGVSISVTPSSGWAFGLTNIQLTVANNIQNGGGTFITDYDVANDLGIKIDALMVNNTVTLGNKASGIPGSFIMLMFRLQRAIINGNTFDNYSDQGLVLAGTGEDESSLTIQGNSLTSMANIGSNQSAMSINYGPFSRNITILNNIISCGFNGPINVYTASTPTNLPGRLVFGNNIYVGVDNASPDKWVRVGSTTITSATTTAGGYVVTDLNPGPF